MLKLCDFFIRKTIQKAVTVFQFGANESMDRFFSARYMKIVTDAPNELQKVQTCKY